MSKEAKPSPSRPHPETHLHELDALGTHWCIESLDSELTAAIRQSITDHITKFQETYTRFTDTSLLGRLNKEKRLYKPPADMLAMLKFARDMFHITGGVFNISVGGELLARGYGKVSGQGNISQKMWDELQATPEKITIPDEMSLDFGGFGKGWLIDELGKLLAQHRVEHFVINGGGDILVNAPEPIEFALEHPLDPNKSIGSTKIQRGALAVSSTIKRSWTKDNQRQHHIIDPRSCAPSENDIVSAYIRADTALIADVCATVLLIDPTLEQALTEKYSLKTILLHHNQLTP
ncbi:FAD:protein FMN transferase [Candidatus Saccharibacteria bacterium]|nr:FAD:protein FMN transferase [Candidatus Saccharibacteria bacterium]